MLQEKLIEYERKAEHKITAKALNERRNFIRIIREETEKKNSS
jgi:hypothetical protein